MGWVIVAILGIAGLAVLFVVLTDGRYFGRGLMLEYVVKDYLRHLQHHMDQILAEQA